MAHVDGLTGLANRRCFDGVLQQEWLRLGRSQKPLSLILCDVDCFKAYNDLYGHQAGDGCLQKVALALRESARRSGDVVARYGGEEFAMILPETDLEGALAVAQNIRERVARLKILHQGSTVGNYLTLSQGVACCIPSDRCWRELIDGADEALYRAKGCGRDRIWAAQ